LTTDAPPTYSVAELNAAIGSLLERGFAPRFLVQATASRPQIKKGHLWLTLTDGNASITAVVWASKLQQLNFVPGDGDGVLVVGKLNFWAARASLAVQVLDLRPSLTTVMRRFEEVREQLLQEGLIDPSRQRPLPRYPRRVALLTSSPSSALADMLRTARERWPLTSLLLLPIPVQGDVAQQIVQRLQRLSEAQPRLALDAIVLARGGGSREDLMVFDDADVCRQLAMSPVPLITGIGHEDDLTVADLVADHRAATPTAAIVQLLPSREHALADVHQRQRHWRDQQAWALKRERQKLNQRFENWSLHHPRRLLERMRVQLNQRMKLLSALAPERWLARGFAILETADGRPLRSITEVQPPQDLLVRLSDGQVVVEAKAVKPGSQR
jgi:exodeoxyribonuclease VII large subunit